MLISERQLLVPTSKSNSCLQMEMCHSGLSKATGPVPKIQWFHHYSFGCFRSRLVEHDFECEGYCVHIETEVQAIGIPLWVFLRDRKLGSTNQVRDRKTKRGVLALWVFMVPFPHCALILFSVLSFPGTLTPGSLQQGTPKLS